MKTVFLALFLTIMVANVPSVGACPSYMVLTCENSGKKVDKPRKPRYYRRIPVEDLKGYRIGTIELMPTGRVRTYDRKGAIVRDIRILMPDYIEDLK